VVKERTVNRRKAMGTLLYRGAEVATSNVAVAKPSIASYRGSTYNPQEVEAAPKAHKFIMNYRGATLEV
jgi:hypothetical protein